MTETTVLSQDLQVGDDLLATALGGHSGVIQSVRVRPDSVVIHLAPDPFLAVELECDEVCSVRRGRP